MTFDLLT